MVERIAKAVGRDGFKVFTVCRSVDVTATVGLRHVLSGDDDLLGQLDQFLHGLGQLLHLIELVKIGGNLHVVLLIVVRTKLRENAHIVTHIVTTGVSFRTVAEGVFQRFGDSVFCFVAVISKAGVGKVAEQLCQQIALCIDAAVGFGIILVKGKCIDLVKQVADILAGLLLLAHLFNRHHAEFILRQLQQDTDVVEESVPLHRLPEGKIAV